MTKTTLAISSLVVLFLSSPSNADLQVQFIESAPKDRFVIINDGSCDLDPAEFTNNFAASNACLVFYVPDTGAGLDPNETIAFTIDGDDTNGTREITVTDSEISGTTVSLVADNTTMLLSWIPTRKWSFRSRPVILRV